MTDFTIVEAKPWHCGAMSRLLRHEHRNAVAVLGIDSHRELRTLFDASAYRRAWLIDGKLAGLGGVTGSEMAAIGFVWLTLTEQGTHYPIAIVKEARRLLDEIMVTKRELATTILAGDHAAKRLAIFLGFHVSHDGPGSPASTRFARRDLARFLDSNPELRIPIGTSYVIPMGYHHDLEAT